MALAAAGLVPAELSTDTDAYIIQGRRHGYKTVIPRQGTAVTFKAMSGGGQAVRAGLVKIKVEEGPRSYIPGSFRPDETRHQSRLCLSIKQP